MSRPVTITIAHELGKDEARNRVRDGFEKLKSQMTGGLMFKFSEEWSSEDTLTFDAKGLGQNITGQIDIFPSHVRIEVVLPSLLATIAETITGKVEKQGRLLLEKK
jgi:Putative polyhydroxyalkanoic acid system protein (PHA_gran_rgn)